VAPGLVAHSANGAIETVYYQFLAPMLLNEYQKQQRTIEALTTRIAELEQDREKQTAEIASLKRQTARIEALEQQAVEIAELKQQAARMVGLLERLERTKRVNTAGR